MNRRAAIAAVVVVTLIFFGLRLGVRLLAREAAPPPAPVVDRSRSTPLVEASPDQLKSDARAKLRVLATEARETNETKAAVAAFAAEEAIGKDDCARADSQLTRAYEWIAKTSRARGAYESARRAVDAFCATVRD